MDLLLQSNGIQSSRISISGSKSETNRLLLLKALYPNISLENISASDDSKVMIDAFSNPSGVVDIHHAGTAMRFLTAYFAIQEEKTTILTGSSRMKERPVGILVNALQQLGADISYEGKPGFPPLKITGKRLVKNQVALAANISSQYISALLLIAPKLANGLEVTLMGEITSQPYIKMTLDLLNEIGVKTSAAGNKITVAPKNEIEDISYTIESDWSSASYFYSIIALSEIGTQITLSNFKENSLQGDAALAIIYENFGVETIFQNGNAILLSKVQNHKNEVIQLDLNNTPDLAQTISVTCFGLGIGCQLSGLHTLKIKETDRLQALQNELTKLGATVVVTSDSLTLEPSKMIHANMKIATYQDHRMAMAFAPLALKAPLIIEDAEVVSKSYPAFWDDLKSIGFKSEEVF